MPFFDKRLPVFGHNLNETSIDALQSKNQVLCEYCKHVSNY